ncbi:MAG: TetR/AcrR family transcriptional regulator, partial [Clostridiales bacterium]|nr:TetR/AcrR family transcriptional regulator [Clostridiales bacterium]
MKKENQRPASQKSRKLIDTARTLFFKHGVKRVTIEEICEKADVSKVTFYRYFNNKEDIVRQIRDELMTAGFSKYDEIIARDIPFPEKIDEMTKWRVAFISQMNSEFIEDIVPFEDTIAEMKKRFMKNIMNAQEKGEVRQDLSPGLIWLAAEKLYEIALDGRWKDAVPDFNELHRQLRTMYIHGLL